MRGWGSLGACVLAGRAPPLLHLLHSPAGASPTPSGPSSQGQEKSLKLGGGHPKSGIEAQGWVGDNLCRGG